MLHPVIPVVDRARALPRDAGAARDRAADRDGDDHRSARRVTASVETGPPTARVQLVTLIGAALIDGEYTITVTGTLTDFFQLSVSGNGAVRPTRPCGRRTSGALAAGRRARRGRDAPLPRPLRPRRAASSASGSWTARRRGSTPSSLAGTGASPWTRTATPGRADRVRRRLSADSRFTLAGASCRSCATSPVASWSPSPTVWPRAGTTCW